VGCCAAGRREDGERGSVVTLLCDSGGRYQSRDYDDAWLAAEGLDLTPYTAELDAFLGT
jgi:cysteine synthase A